MKKSELPSFRKDSVFKNQKGMMPIYSNMLSALRICFVSVIILPLNDTRYFERNLSSKFCRIQTTLLVSNLPVALERLSFTAIYLQILFSGRYLGKLSHINQPLFTVIKIGLIEYLIFTFVNWISYHLQLTLFK